MTRAYTTLIFIFTISVVSILAQPGNPGSAPIGGVIYLLLAAVGLGVYSLRSKKK